MTLPASLRPLRHRAFAILWTGSLVSNIGTWMQTVAVGALVTGVTRNPIWTAVVFVAGFLPNGVLAPVGGALADRFDRRRSIIAFVAIEGGISGVLAVVVAAGNTDPYLVTGLVFVAGCMGALRMPFQQAILPDVVPPDDIVGAISLGSAQWNLGRVLGPALAGVVIVAGSFSAAFAVNALSFVAVIVSFLFVSLPAPVRTDDDAGILAHMRDGVRVARANPAVRAAIGLIAIAAALTAPFIALVPAVADSLVGGDGDPEALAGPTGVLTTAQGVGAVAAALIYPSLVARFGRLRMLLVVCFLTPLALVPYALAGSVPLAAAAIVVVGGAYICVLSGLSAVVQLRAPAAYRGRILSLYFATLSVVFPIGALAQGAIARRVGLEATTIGGAAVFIAVLLAIAVFRPALLRALEDETDDEPPIVTDPASATELGDRGDGDTRRVPA